MKSFLGFLSEETMRKYLSEGGNIEIGGTTSEPLHVKDREQHLKSIHKMLSSVNKSTGHVLFGKHENALKKGTAFAGSTHHLMNPSIKTSELHKVKPSFGDLDVQIPAEHKDHVEKALATGAKHGDYTVVGTKKHGSQISAVMKHKSGAHHQVDFESKPYDAATHEPTKFSQMSNNSHYGDLKSGLKGVFHKYLLGATTSANKQSGVVQSTKRGKVVHTPEEDIKAHTFSVASGLRQKHTPVIEGGKHKTVGGKLAYHEQKPSESHYDTDLSSIHHKIFGKKPGSGDVEAMHSFHGVAGLMKKHMNSEQQRNVVHSFVNKAYHPKEGQLLSKDHKVDQEMKDHAIHALRQHFPEHFDKPMEAHIRNQRTEFYKNKQK